MSNFETGLSWLFEQSTTSAYHLFWYTLVFEIPRYLCSFLALAASKLAFVKGKPTRSPRLSQSKITIGIIGHNEADSVEKCVRSLREQSIKGLELIIVSDGSNDGMHRLASKLVKLGLADKALATDLRGGKSAGINLAIASASGEIFVVVDCDCSYDRFAVENIIAPFSDPQVGAVAGDVIARNGEASLVARFQAIEYLITLSVAKRIGAELGQIDCISGAFGAFRMAALREVGCYDVGGGEDLDLTIRLRARGWRVAFAPDALCYTAVPVRLSALIRQRRRWDRDAVRLRYRKHRHHMTASSPRFRLSEAVHQWDSFLFTVVGAIAFPIYLVWLFGNYGEFALSIIIAMQLALFVLDVLTLALADIVTGRRVFWQYLPYMVGYSVFTSYVMRLVRLWAYFEEWFLFASVHDNFVPLKVRRIRRW